MGEVGTYADGGSAKSQASSDDAHRWPSRPWASRGVRTAALLAPVVGSFLLTRVYAILVEPAVIGAPAYWVGMFVIACASAIVIERWSRSLLPVAAMFRLSLAFPDQAPSRFGVALRGSNTKHLSERLGGDDETAAAGELLALIGELSAHDPMTRGHSERVRAYSDLIGAEMGLSQDERDRLAWGALAHDVGKLDVDPAILNKPGRPTAEEWAVIRTHPAQALHRMAPLYRWLGQWALASSQHHERWDGGGYPAGLAGEEISLAGRIVAVADAYDVMTAARSYKEPLRAEAARAELARNAGSQFDPEVVRAFLRVGLGKMRAVGPLAWLSEAAWLARIPQSISAVGSTAASTAVAATVSIAASAVPAITDSSPVEGVQRSVEVAEAEPLEPTPGAEGASTTDRAPASTTTTATVAEEDTAPTSTTAAVSVTTEPPASVASDPGGSTDLVSTTTDPPAGETTASTTTTTLGATTTTLAATTTTASPTTTTTAGPTTTTTTTQAPAETDFADAVHLEGRTGSAIDFLKLDSALSGGALGNLDSDRNGDIGLTLAPGGLAATDDDKRQRFSAQSPDSFTLNGTPRVELWVATADFDTATSGTVVVGLYDCAANKTSGCVLLTSGSESFAQSTFGGDFGRVTVDLGALDVTLGSNRSLILSVTVDAATSTDLWFAFGTNDYPSSFQIR